MPSQGGSSLGMARHHSSIRHYTLGEFAREQETSHRHTLRQHLRQEKLNARKMKVNNFMAVSSSIFVEYFHSLLLLFTGYCKVQNEVFNVFDLQYLIVSLDLTHSVKV